MNSVVGIDVVLFEELVREVSASFESELLGETESIVAVEKDVFDLWRWSVGQVDMRQEEAYLTRHLEGWCSE